MSATLFDNIPLELRQCAQWGLWRYEQRGEGKPTKVPCTALGGFKASVTNQRDWTAFEKVCDILSRHRYDGIGFVLTDADPYTAVDVDNVDPANLAGLALEIAQRFNSYTEISPSGQGLRIFVKGKLPGKGVNRRSQGVEMYDRQRYVTVTGNVLHKVPIRDAQEAIDWLCAKLDEGRTSANVALVAGDEVETDAAIVDRINADPSAEKLRRLADGQWQHPDWQSEYPSQSEADMACMNMLARYTHNPAQLARLFRQTELGRREKADRDSYVMPMVSKAIASTPLKPTAEATDAAAGFVARLTANGQAPASRKRITNYSAADLQVMHFEPVQYIIENMIPQGLTLLAGKPKAGKSWLALDISSAVAEGGSVLTNEAAVQGDVLYAALEDTARRMQSRLTLQREGKAWPKGLTFWHEMKPLDQGGEVELRNWIAAHPNAKLIIIDVLNRVRPMKSKGEDSYAYDMRSLSPLKAIADDFNIAVIVIHHTRKMEALDPFDTVSGTLGLTGTADTILIFGPSGSGVLTLSGQGRDIEHFTHAVEFDDNRRLYITDAEPTEGRSGTRLQIMGAMNFGADDATTIAKHTSLPYERVRSQLRRMLKDGEVVQPTRGKFKLPPTGTSSQWMLPTG